MLAIESGEGILLKSNIALPRFPTKSLVPYIAVLVFYLTITVHIVWRLMGKIGEKYIYIYMISSILVISKILFTTNFSLRLVELTIRPPHSIVPDSPHHWKKKLIHPHFTGENASCNGCLAHRKKCQVVTQKKARELSRKYGEEHKEEKKACGIQSRMQSEVSRLWGVRV